MAYRALKRRKRVLFYLVAVLMVCAFTAVVGRLLFLQWFSDLVDIWAPSRYVTDVQGLERDLGVQLPQMASDIHNVGYAFWQSRIIGVRFSIPPDDLGDSLGSLGFTRELQEGLYPFDAPRINEGELVETRRSRRLLWRVIYSTRGILRCDG